nr:hypothetical protein GCM10020093_110800 [Planobispora longispora]
MAVHLVVLALWVGGLAVLCAHALRGQPHLEVAATRFSSMALWCFIGVGLSGLFSVVARLTSLSELFTSAYGLLLLAKTAAFALLGVAGWWHRRRTLPQLASARSGASGKSGAGRSGAFARFAIGEVVIMFAAVGLAVALSRTAPPPAVLPADRAFELLGYPMPPEISPANLASLWWLDLFSGTLAVLLGGLYLAGVRRLARRGDSWPWGRTAAWFTGVLILVVATQSGVARYAKVLFSVHMVEHMTLSMLVPIFLVLGAPVTLALRALKPAARRGTAVPASG